MNKQTISNSLYPFFWLHGEKPEVLLHYMDKIEQSGMKGVCLEARPHPEFIKEGWWHDLDLILQTAEKKDMKVWILDDSHFPTGYANGEIEKNYPQYLKQYLAVRRYDVHGPQKKIRIHLPVFRGRIFEQPDPQDQVLRIVLARRSDLYRNGDPVFSDSLADITSSYDEKKRELALDVKEGEWSIFVLYITPKGEEESTKGYLNPLVKEATQVLIDTVYEPHYEHYAPYFGHLIEGFFSDEPRFGNTKGTEASIGTDMPLPWRPGLEQLLSFDLDLLPLLFVKDEESRYREVRTAYMDLVTQLYNENFTKVLADWCHDHHVAYLGHTIEDNGAHTRLGYGTGHYFRGQQDMDLAGIDVIGTQIVPGMAYHHDSFSTGGANGEFYHYALAKLASSAAHLDPKKQGRAMCEAFGAYGWNEGLALMKGIVDPLMVRGINYIVPHAFDPKEFPDWDCPPHFYAHGHNPQFEQFSVLMNYINTITSIFKNGHYPASAAILYPAELEWAGRCMPVEKPCRILTQHQIPFDIVTHDYILQSTIKDGSFLVNQTRFDTLIVPACEYVPACIKNDLIRLHKAGVEILFIDQLPENMTAGNVAKLNDLGHLLHKKACIELSSPQSDLAAGNYEKDGWHICMLANESTYRTIDCKAAFSTSRPVYCFDPMTEELTEEPVQDGWFELQLVPGQTLIYFYGRTMKDVKKAAKYTGEPVDLPNEWTVSAAEHSNLSSFEQIAVMSSPRFISDQEGWEQICGIARYETSFHADESGNYLLKLDDVQETAEVFVNGICCGTRICAPFDYDLSHAVRPGINALRIEVRNTLGTVVRDPLSHYLPIQPFGLDGKIALLRSR